MSERKHCSRKRRLFMHYAYDYLRLSRKDAVRDLGDHRRWRWLADPATIELEPDTFNPIRDDDYATYTGHFEFDREHGRVWHIDSQTVHEP